MEYKDTLLMPKTKFPMRGGLPTKEPQIQQEWKEKDLYRKMLEKNEGQPSFILHDGPPYANGNLHMGHALNKILKDFINRYKTMQGFYTPYVPGWDTHGLPIEQALTKKGVKRKEMTTAEFRDKCQAFAMEQIDIQKKDFLRLGVNGDFDNPYITLKPEYEAAQIRLFGEMADKGLIYKGKKPVYWSPSSESSLAEAEIEYHDKRSASIYVAFDVKDSKGIVADDAKFIIWTTTPWTLPSNVAITVHPELTYVQMNVDGTRYIIAEALVDAVAEQLGWDKEAVVREKDFKGSELEYIEAQHPFIDRISLIINGEHVTTDAGTGCVHTAPGHGEDDFIVGQKYGLEVISPLDDKGVFTAEGGPFEGMFYDKANQAVTELLTEKGALLKLDFITHSYPHDWRTKKPVIFRATPQWFASISKVRQDILDAIEDTKFKVDWGKTRIYNMIRDRGEWVISRQRVWGVPLPVFYAENGDIIMTKETVYHVADLFEQHGSNIWFERDAKDLLPEGFTHPGSPNGEFTKEQDIMDVWFDSGSSHRGVLETRPELSFPADMYLEGSDQYRGWFNSSITTSVATRGRSPYKMLLSHGFVMDGEGKKMSKSLGNVIVPDTIVKQKGADIARLWVSSVDYLADVRISDEILNQVADVYRKIRNTLRFLLGNINDYNPATDRIAEADLLEVDRYILNRLREFTAGTLDHYESFDYLNIYQEVQNFINVELSNFYLDYGKDILYIEEKNAHKRRSMQTVLFEILVNMTKLLAPIIPHTAEEVWSHIEQVDEESVHLTNMPAKEEVDQALLDKWNTFMALRDDVNRALEAARNEKVIGKSLEAKVKIGNSSSFDTLAFLEGFNDLHQLFIVSQVELVEDTKGEAYQHGTIEIAKADGEKCARCWNYSESLGSVGELDDLCPRCQEVVKTLV
ncbi:isoleucine--tRNA ligase [Staphylococcus pseudintermedius]|uniref:isoleucine--tRNA ligase n=1 Tax=Staphylococcus pseudintermedius TaxID=283734 RepID=UPI0001F6BF53|nr:isoleucine--tRNA ligase [Staphylococcus pseudintermedius]ADV05426.1 Isoleucyl-tRNA synthetase [Staphylococcus pseudintermedius HKU10-03]ADX76865.1 isoleucine-tRNA ligase [Staphylococcus pseudintermedius ED99]ASQ50872.1 isoleucine--tRNA ligase [Staphylococcus pseudintermedius]EGQ0290534.1 isoleucine--tRNA ligase [Staphylococcus pseudintermedius]EGQ0299414.1 isoleucine--tRNA ligase [Staphylococcus pseudintermedius]